MHLCAGIIVVIDDSKRKMSTLVKRENDSKVLVVSVIGEYLSVSFYCY